MRIPPGLPVRGLASLQEARPPFELPQVSPNEWAVLQKVPICKPAQHFCLLEQDKSEKVFTEDIAGFFKEHQLHIWVKCLCLRLLEFSLLKVQLHAILNHCLGVLHLWSINWDHHLTQDYLSFDWPQLERCLSTKTLDSTTDSTDFIVAARRKISTFSCQCSSSTPRSLLSSGFHCLPAFQFYYPLHKIPILNSHFRLIILIIHQNLGMWLEL